MEEIVLKREATVTSADALDQINAAYPDAEILSFRKIKEAGNSSEFFIARIGLSAEADESGDVVLDSDEIVVEDKKHEEKEEEKMNQIIDLLKQLVDQESSEEVEPAAQVPAPDDHERKPLPEPEEPPFGVGDVAGAETNITPVASIVVEREASVPKKVARLELIREFAGEYKIGEVKKHGAVYRASLEKIAEDDDDSDRVNALAEDWQERHKEMEEQARHLEAERKKESEEMRNAPKRKGLLNLDSKVYSPDAKHWLEFMDESGATDEQIERVKEKFRDMNRTEQEVFVKEKWKNWRRYHRDWEPEKATGEVKRYDVNERARAAINAKIQNLVAQIGGETDERQEGLAQREYKNLLDLARMLPQIPTEEQYASVMSIIGDTPSKPSPKDVRSELRDILRSAPEQVVPTAPIQQPEQEEVVEKPEGWDPNDKPSAMADFGVSEYTPPRTYDDYMQDMQPDVPATPNANGTYLEYLDSLYGPSRGEGNYNPQEWENQLAEYNNDPEGYESGWSGNIKNRVVR